MCMSMTCELSMVQLCSLCGNTFENHAHNCPQKHLDSLCLARENAQASIIGAACCGSQAIELNVDDIYECRNCHKQFATYDGYDDVKRYHLETASGKEIVAFCLERRGNGKFRYDEAIERLSALVEKAREENADSSTGWLAKALKREKRQLDAWEKDVVRARRKGESSFKLR